MITARIDTFVPFVAFVPFALVALPAQESMRTVPPGREIAEHKLLSLGSTDTWDLEVVAGEVVHCTVDTGEFDPVLELVDSAGERLAIDDGHGSHSELRHIATAASKLRLRVTGFESRGGGNYRFWLERYRTETLAAAGTDEHEFGPEQWWHYRVPLHAGDVIAVGVVGDGRLTAVFDDAMQRPPEWQGGYTATRDGELLLRIEGAERGHARTTVQLATQRALPASGRLDGEMVAGGMHLLRMHLEPSAYELALDGPEHPLSIDFRDRAPSAPGRDPRWCWTGHLDKNGRNRRWLLVREACDCELLIRNPVASPGSYAGRFVPLAAALPADTDVDGALPLGDGLVYELPARLGDVLALDLRSDAFDAMFDVWSPRGQVRSFDDRGSCDLDPRHDGFLVDEPGTWRVLVYSPGGHGSGAFRLRCDRLRVAEVAVGGTLPVELRGADRWVHLPLAENEPIWLSLDSRAFDAALTVVAPDGKDLGTFEGGGLDGSVLTAFRAGAAGTYTIVLRARAGAGAGELAVLRPGGAR